MGWCEYQIKLHAEVNEWRKGIINFVAKIYRVTNTEKKKYGNIECNVFTSWNGCTFENWEITRFVIANVVPGTICNACHVCPKSCTIFGLSMYLKLAAGQNFGNEKSMYVSFDIILINDSLVFHRSRFLTNIWRITTRFVIRSATWKSRSRSARYILRILVCFRSLCESVFDRRWYRCPAMH
jgi:hypothetical protein